MPGQHPSESQTLQVWGGGLGNCVSESPRGTWLQGFQGTHLEEQARPSPHPHSDGPALGTPRGTC